MTMQTLDMRKLLALLLLAFVIVMMWGGIQAWTPPGLNDNYPTNDCGQNHFLTFTFECNGQTVEHTRGGATDRMVKELEESFKGKADMLTSARDYAYQYIEQWFFK